MAMLRRSCAALAFGAIALAPRASRALDVPEVGGAPMRLDVTETAIGNWRFDNRNGLTDDDHYGEWINRLDTRLSWKRWTVGFRLDSAAYYFAPTPGYLASKDIDAQPPGTGSRHQYYRARLSQYETSLSDRYRQSIYPSKLFVTYATPEIELTAGDFYVQLGRGLVLSLRKIDEVAIDTTLRGAKAEWRGERGDFRWTGTLVGGWANPVRVDESSGRRLTAPSSWYFAGMPAPDPGSPLSLEQTENFRPDGLSGVQLEAGTSDVVAGVRASVLSRGGLHSLVRSVDPGTVQWPSATIGRLNDYVETGSVSVSMPNLPQSSVLYVEAAGQRLDNGTAPLGGPAPGYRDATGHAVYGSFGIGGDPVNVLVEVRHTRRFWPLLANVDTRASEFLLVAYSNPPTTEPITTDTEFNSFGVCTTGGRARVDWRTSQYVSLYGTLGHYRTWNERGDACGIGGKGLSDADRNDVWDPFVGVNVSYDEHRSHGKVWGGVRLDETAEPFVDAAGDVNAAGEPTNTIFYREAYVRYDWFHVLNPTWALQDQGFHRAREARQTDVVPWKEGENYLAVQWNARLIAAFGYEYTNRGGDWMNFVNGSVMWRFTPSTSVRTFVGQQRGALRCVSGVCRVFPPFEGAKVELVARF